MSRWQSLSIGKWPLVSGAESSGSFSKSAGKMASLSKSGISGRICGRISCRTSGRTGFVRLILLLLLTCHAQAHGDELQFLTEEYPPLTFLKGGEVSGLGAEVVQEIQRRTGNRGALQMMPWARAYQSALLTPNVVLFTTTRTAERESLFKWVGPVATMKTSLYAKRGSDVRIASLAEAKRMAGILTVREYYSHQFLKREGFTKLDVVNTPETMLKMLLGERRVLMASDNLLMPALVDNAGVAMDAVKLVYTFMESQTYIAFSRGTSDDIVRDWQMALDQMKRDGSFDRLYKKWLPGEVPPGIRPGVS